jgi:hypothetical protein
MNLEFVQDESMKKMSASRCARLIAKGMMHHVDEMWIGPQPVLLMSYLSTYAPWLCRQVI